jgi:thiol-disulfide isomerase/thioredoxin
MGPRTPRARSLALALVVGLVAAACASDGSGDAVPSGPSPTGDGVAERGSIPAGNAVEARGLPTTADALPAASFEDFEALIAELRGTPILVNIWASWCPPCRAEMPYLVDAHEEIGDRVQFLGIDILDARVSAREFIEEFGMTFPSLFDETGEIRDRLGLFGQPGTVFYDANGERVATWNGSIPEPELRRQLDRLLRG